jgi:hypothetical protein
MRPITSRTALVISQTEVFHRSCAGSIERSRGSRQSQRILELERELELAKRAAATARHQVSSAMTECSIARGHAEVARREAAQLRDERRDERAVAQTSIAELRQERDAARSEARAASALLATRLADQTATSGNPDDKDDTQTRFAMMELD